MSTPQVAVIMGSKSDLDVVSNAFKVFREFGVSFTARIISAHRTPEQAAEFAKNAESSGIRIIICAAGMAAHLGGVIAAYTTLPIVAIPLVSEPFSAVDSLLAMIQMPPGIPVAAVTAGKAGAKNAALYAISILALNDSILAQKLKDFRKSQMENVLQADQELQKNL